MKTVYVYFHPILIQVPDDSSDFDIVKDVSIKIMNEDNQGNWLGIKYIDKIIPE